VWSAIGWIAGSARAIELDLSQVSFIDCGGVRAIVDFHDRVHDNGGDLTVAPLSQCVSRIVTLLHLDHLTEPGFRDATPGVRGPAHRRPTVIARPNTDWRRDLVLRA